jgi:hypothetical protein
MKTRNGFVSNSSSSSFVVAFPKKPKNEEEVYQMMFNGEDGSINPYPESYSDMTHREIAIRVFEDLQSDQSNEYKQVIVPASLNDIVIRFTNRYHYYSSTSCIHVWNTSTDEIGGQWGIDENSGYYGLDKNLMIKFRDFVVNMDKEEKVIRKEEQKLWKRFHLKRPKSNSPESEFDAYYHAMDDFRNSDSKMKTFKVKQMKQFHHNWEILEKLRRKIAEVDAKAFLKDNNKAFIAILEYADDGGEGVLEHGDIYGKIDLDADAALLKPQIVDGLQNPSGLGRPKTGSRRLGSRD